MKSKKRDINPFSEAMLSYIFELDPNQPDRIVRRKNASLEFKANFNWNNRSRIGKSAASFANNRGGHIIFGVANNPRILKGMDNDKFEDTDPKHITDFFNAYFSPEIHWEQYMHVIDGKKFGLLYIAESETKPIICTNSIEKLDEGDIYYRYRGQDKKIRYPELYNILSEHRKQERDKFLELFRNISKVGVHDAAILGTKTGEIIGPSGKTFLIDEELLPKLKFVTEGRFTETEGDPTLKLVGDLVPAGVVYPIKEVKREVPIAIGTSNIVLSFLDQQKVENPKTFVDQIANENSGFLPVYYYLKMAGLSKNEAIESIEKIRSRNHGKTKIIERLSISEDFSETLKPSRHPASSAKLIFREKLLDENFNCEISPFEVRYLCSAIRSLNSDEISFNYILPLLQEIFDKYFTIRTPVNVSTDIRKAICHVDILQNYRECK